MLYVRHVGTFLKGYDRCDPWVNTAPVFPDCFDPQLIVVSKIIITIHFATEK